MTSNVKKIIAREGLIIIGLIATSLLITFQGGKLVSLPKEIPFDEAMAILDREFKHKTSPMEETADNLPDIIWDDEIENSKLVAEVAYPPPVKYYNKTNYSRYKAICSHIENFALFLLFLAYPLYLLFRFIIWAVKTVREK